MSKCPCFSILVVSSLCVPAQTAKSPQTPAMKPQQVVFTPLEAESLIAACKGVDANPSTASSMSCLSYISGFTDGWGVAMARFNHENQSAFCPAPEVTRPQMAKVIVKYGDDHPNLLWSGAALFTALALKDAYPCEE